MRWLFSWPSEQDRCDRENANPGWPHRRPGDGWQRTAGGALVSEGCVRPVAKGLPEGHPPKPKPGPL